jgi:hypothetical protein
MRGSMPYLCQGKPEHGRSGHAPRPIIPALHRWGGQIASPAEGNHNHHHHVASGVSLMAPDQSLDL